MWEFAAERIKRLFVGSRISWLKERGRHKVVNKIYQDNPKHEADTEINEANIKQVGNTMRRVLSIIVEESEDQLSNSCMCQDTKREGQRKQMNPTTISNMHDGQPSPVNNIGIRAKPRLANTLSRFSVDSLTTIDI